MGDEEEAANSRSSPSVGSPKETLMTEDTPAAGLRTRLSILLPALWLAIGASFKLFAGTPKDLPPVLFDLGVDIDLLFRLAIGIELSIVALALLRPALGWRLLALQYVIFLGLLVQLQASGAESCGCMGSSVTLTPLTMMAIDGVLFALLLLAKPWQQPLKSSGPAWLAPAAVAGLMAFPWLYIDSGSTPPAPAPEGDGSEAPQEVAEKPRYVVLEPDKWVDQDVFSTPLASWVDFESGALPIDGLYVFYRQTCEHCADHLMKLFEADVGLPMVLVKINEKGDNAENDLILVKPSGPHIIEIELDPEIEWVIETPADIELAGGLVIRGEEGIGKD